ncbi:hypothetical protein XFF7766_1150031 [Xanthomonas citri pv. fuscans]|nr:hypothetical protein XFF7766_1150031 [Xanthomonas citri pv. fuscans]
MIVFDFAAVPPHAHGRFRYTQLLRQPRCIRRIAHFDSHVNQFILGVHVKFLLTDS